MPGLRLLVFSLILVSHSLSSPAQVTEPVDLGSYSQVLYVSVTGGSDVSGLGTQASPYQSINRALQEASDASESAVHAILVASGTYSGSPSTLDSLTPWIHLYGGFDPLTWQRDILTYKTTNNGAVEAGASHTIIDGFALTRESDFAVSISFVSVQSATLSNCTIKDNVAVDPLYSMVCYMRYSSLHLRNCTFSSNYGGAAGAIGCFESSLTLDTCLFSNNTAVSGHYFSGDNAAGGLYLSQSDAVITNCTISGNKSGSNGGGIFSIESNAIITGCTITNNSELSTSGGGVYCEGGTTLSLTNCLIANNSTTGTGGAFYCKNSNVSLVNCTVAGNTDNKTAGGITSVNSSFTITNSIFWNKGQEIYLSGTGTHTATYSCIQGGYTGDGNIDAFPLFVSLTSGNYHLLNGSPCIDTASVTAAPSADIAGSPRPGNDGRTDIGAYESTDDYLEGDPTELHRYYVNSKAMPGGTGLSWSEALPSIEDVFWYAPSGTEIFVASGTYAGPIRLEPNTAVYGGFAGTEPTLTERNLVLNPSIIDAAQTSEAALIGAENTLLDGFTLTGGHGSLGGGLYYSTITSATIANCIIHGNTTHSTGSGAGLYCTSASPIIKSCTFINNSSDYTGGAVYLRNSSPVFDRCLLQSNSAEVGGALACEDSSPALINCILTGNSASLAGAGLYCYDSAPSLTHCTIAGNSPGFYAATGIYCSGSTLKVLDSILWNMGAEIRLDSSTAQVNYSCVQGGWAGSGNINVYPAFVGPSTGDWRLAAGSPCIDSGTIDLDVTTDFSGSARPGGDGKVDMGAYESSDDLTPTAGFSPSRLYIASSSAVGGDGLSWAQALPQFNDALWLTGGHTEFWVASGDYMESIWLEPGVSVFGGLSGDEETLPESRGLSTIDASLAAPFRPISAAEGVVLDHLLITGASHSYDGALYFDQVDSATVSDCIISGNTTDYAGGVLCAYSSPTFLHCTISNNWTGLGAGGFHCDPLSSPRLEKCTISGNHTEFDGGGVYCYTASPLIQQCTITGNSSAQYGGGILVDSSTKPTFQNCLITGNTAFKGASLSCTGSDPVFTNCTFAGNIADVSGESLFFDFSPAQLTNCIHWSNSPYKVAARDDVGYAPEAFYCDFEGGWPGLGAHNIQDNPLFAGDTDYHLLAASPCIGSGTGPANNPPVPAVDIDGDVRTGTTCDIGADEYNGPTTVIDWFGY